MWVPVVAKYHQPAKFRRPFSNRNGRTGGTSSNRTPRHDVSGPRSQVPSAARKSSVNRVSAASAAATAALVTSPARHRTDQERANSTDKTSRRAALIGKGLTYLSRDSGPAKSEEEWAGLVRGWFPELADTRLRQVTWPAISGHHDYIVAQLKAGVRMSTIHQRLRDERGLAASVASFRRYVAANVPEEVRRSQVTVWNPHPAEAGEQAQIDYGQLGRWLDPVTGKLRTVWAFVMVLACSRHMFVRPVLKMDQRAWTECHVAAFEFFGGVPARLVPEYVPRNIFRLLCPAPLCGRGDGRRPR